MLVDCWGLVGQIDSTLDCSGKFDTLRIDGAKVTKPAAPFDMGDARFDFSSAFDMDDEGDDAQGPF